MTKNKKRSFGALVGLFLFLNLFSVAHTNNLTELRANMGIALTVIHLPSSETSRNTLNTSEQTPYQRNLSKAGFIALQSEKKLPGQVLLSNSSVAQNQTSLSLSASAAVTITSTSLGTGDWSDGASWDSGTPSSTDDVVINSDITIDGNFTCQSLTIQNGASLTFGGGFSLTVNGNVLNSGTLTAISGSNLFVNGNLTNDATINGASNSNITVTGNWTNNNTYTANGGTVTFTSSGSTISGTTTFDNLDINAGSDVNSVISVTSDITVGNLLLENGLLQINGGTTTVTALNDPGTNPLHNTIPSSAGIEVTTGGTINTGDFTISNEGLIRVVDGIANFGISAGNSIETQYDGAFIVDGGSVNIAGRLHNSASGRLPGTSITSGISMTGGMVTLSTIGNGLSNTGALNVTAAGNFNFSNGTIVIQNPNSTSGVDMDLQLLTGGGNKTIGNTATLQIGNGSTPPGSIFVITSQIDIPNLETSSNADIQLSSNLSITNSLTLSGKLQLNGNEIEVPVTNFLAQTIPLADNNGTPIPITVQLTGGNAGPGASITISTTESKHPNNKNTTNYLNRYWTINSNNITNPVFDILATYLNTEFSGSETDISSGVWTALPWVKGGTVNSGANTVSATGISEAAFEISGISTAPPAITINEGETASICDGSSIDLTTTSSGDPTLTYSWESDPVGFAATTEDVTDNPTANTSYTVTVTDGNGFTAFDQIDITIDPLIPVGVSIVEDANLVCEGTSVTFTATPTNGGTTPSYQWQVNNINQGTDSPTFSYIPANGDNVTVILTSSETCTSGNPATSNTVNMTVYPLLPVGVSILEDANPVCEGTSVTFTATPTNGGTTPSYQWQVNNINQGTDSPTFSYIPANGDNVTVILTSSETCTSGNPATSNMVNMTVYPTPTATAPTDQTYCNGITTAPIPLLGSPPEVSFNISGGASIGLTDVNGVTEIPSFTTSPGTKTISVTPFANGCTGTPATFTITVQSTPTAGAIGSDQNICPNTLPTTFNSITAGTGTAGATISYIWEKSIDDGANWTTIAGQSSASYTSPALSQTTWFHRITTSTLNAIACNSVASNVVVVTVADITPPNFTVPSALTVYTDASCNVNILPASTGNPTNKTDNCTASAALVPSYTDDAPVTGSCPDNYTVTRHWTVTDGSGNATKKTQLITVADNRKPLISIPPNISIKCNDEQDPDINSLLGKATATDNCTPSGSIAITYSDAITPGTCSTRYTITRTWKATDACGNETTDNQTINVSDTEGPIVTMPDLSASCPSTIPPIYSDLQDFINDGGTATDLCGPVTIQILFENEISYGLEDKPGYCPDYLERTYRFTDPCGNFVDKIQTIIVAEECGCNVCDDITSFYWVDFLGDPNGTKTFEDAKREGKCCPNAEYWQKPGNNPFRCVSFNVRIDDDAIGVQIIIDSGAKPDVKEWLVDCENVQLTGPNGDIICLPSGGFHLFTYCKQGGNPNDVTFNSVPGIIASNDITTRVDCQGQIDTEGDFTNPRWTSVSPGAEGAWNHYLYDPLTMVSGSGVNVEDPIFVPDENAPAEIKYQICADLGDYYCDTYGANCDTITVYVKERINLELNIDPSRICVNDPLNLVANVSPASSYYQWQWFDGPGGTGNVISTTNTLHFDPPVELHTYSVRVIDYDPNGLMCNTQVSDFEVQADVYEALVFTPPGGDLYINCNSTTALQDIQDWLASATATDDDGSPLNVVNNYTGIDLTCGTTLPVTFTAVDDCGNIGTATAYINIIDTKAPILSPNTSDDEAICSGLDPNTNPDYLNWLANHAGARATDQCDDDLSWTDDHASQSWVIDPVNHTKTITVTFTATDDCLNAVVTQPATFTITDEILPDLTCPTGPFVLQAPVGACDLVINDPSLDPTYSDGCSVATLTFSMANPDGSVTTGTGSVDGQTFQVGITTVTYTVTDDVNNSVSCNFDVQVTDLNKPIFTYGCPSNPAPVNAEAGVCDAQVNIPVPDVSDPCNEGYTLVNDYNNTNDASDRYPVGTTIVTWTVTDASNNSETCQQTVIVIDNQPPTITCPGNVEDEITNNDCDLISDQIGEPTITENCSYTLTYVRTFEDGSSDNGTGSVSSLPFPVGLTTVEYTVTDGALQTAQCSFTVWIKNLVAPQFAVTCRTGNEQNITVPADPGACEANVTVLSPIIDNPCNEVYTITNDFNNTDNASGIYPIGETTVTWTIEDASGNIYYCTQTVTVEDTQAPTITCQGDVEDEIIDGGCDLVSGLVTAPSVSDNCPNPVLSYELTFEDGSTITGNGSAHLYPFPVGKTIIHYTVTDAALLTDECTYTVWIKNLVLPQFTVTCRTSSDQNITVPADPGVCQANVTVLSPIIDNPCNEVYSITNDFNNSANASGIYPIGETTVTWTIIDASGKVYNCTQTVAVEDTQPPVFTTCPGNYEQEIINNGCDLANVNVPQPVYTDNCPNPVLTYELIYPDLTIATGTGSVTGMTFPVGVTTVNYTVTDGALLTDVCSFTVWVKNLADPPFQVACPVNVNVPADEYVCEAVVTVPAPGITNPCNELYTVVNDSPYRTSDTNASGTYPIGSTTFDWTITDASGNVTVCPQTVTVTDLMPRLTCPADIVVHADFELPYKDVVDVDPPVYSDNCPNPVLNWSMVDPSGNTTTGTGDPSGINIFPSPSRFNIGVSTITYELIDMYNNRVECSFTVTVLGEPVIECQLPIIHDTDPGTCTYTTNPGSPTLVSGLQPITWTWTITDPDGNTQASGSMEGSVGNPGPPDIGDQTFELGTSIITWTACNISGCDECTQEITVEDHEKPTFSSAPFANCVDNLFLASYTNIDPVKNIIINPDPDYYTLKAGSIALDLTNLDDNCCDPLTELTIHWRIDFIDVPDPDNQPTGTLSHPSIIGTGQPSTYGSDILLWGDGINFTNVVHAITYWVDDCHGNTSGTQTQNITITPRPNVIKIN